MPLSMFRIRGIKLSQKLDTIHILGNASSNVVITIETDCTVCNGLGSLTVWSRHDNAIRAKPFLQLSKEPRGRGETTDEPDGFHHPSREDDLVLDGGGRSFYGGLKQFGDFITVNTGYEEMG